MYAYLSGGLEAQPTYIKIMKIFRGASFTFFSKDASVEDGMSKSGEAKVAVKTIDVLGHAVCKVAEVCKACDGVVGECWFGIRKGWLCGGGGGCLCGRVCCCVCATVCGRSCFYTFFGKRSQFFLFLFAQLLLLPLLLLLLCPPFRLLTLLSSFS